MEVMEASAHDAQQGGYFETYERDWTLAKINASATWIRTKKSR